MHTKPILAVKKIIFPLIIILSCVLYRESNTWGKVYLDIDAPVLRQIAIAVPDFQPQSGTVKQLDPLSAGMSESLSNLLRMTGFFTVVNKKAYLEDTIAPPGGTAASVHFADWTAIGADYLVKGFFTYRGNDLILTCRLYDVVKGETLLDTNYTGKQTEMLSMTRKFAGEILLALTGEGGIFTTRIAFVNKRRDAAEILSVNFDGSELKKEREGRVILMSPRWSPNGRYLSFTSYEAGNPDFYLKDLVSSTATKVASFKGINLSGGWSPDSRKVLLTLSKDGNEEIYTLDLENRILQRLTNNFAIDVSPSWSPDGNKIVFVSNRAGSPQVYIMDANGSNVKRLTYEGNYNTSPAWSPKGDRIVYESRINNRFQIVTIGADGENMKQLTFDNGESNAPSWSPDGRYIVFSNGDKGKKKITIMDVTGTYKRELFAGNGDCVLPSWSPRFKSN